MHFPTSPQLTLEIHSWTHTHTCTYTNTPPMVTHSITLLSRKHISSYKQQYKQPRGFENIHVCVEGNSSSWDPSRGHWSKRKNSTINDWEEGWKISSEKGEMDKKERKRKKESLIADSAFNHGRPATIYHDINTQLKPIHQLYSAITLYMCLFLSFPSLTNVSPSSITALVLCLFIPLFFKRSVSIFTSAVGF